MNKQKGIEFTNGSLGNGIISRYRFIISSKEKNKNFKTYVLIGDGECNEGSIWEAAMSAPHFKLDNLIAILDNNNFQQTGSCSEILDTGSLKKKSGKLFGWETVE